MDLKRPRSVKICHAVVPIKYASDKECEERSVLGWYDCKKVLITVNRSLSTPLLIDTLFHEILHAIVSLNEIMMNKKTASEEEFVLRLSPLIISFILDNPDFIEWVSASHREKN